MNKTWILVISVVCATMAACLETNLSQIGGSLKGITDTAGLGQELSEAKIVSGLKEALQIGTENAVKTVSRSGGYSSNPEIRIPLPESVKDAAGLLRTAGMGKQLDAFELSMNQAAEKAAPKAKAIFWEAIREMTLSDARAIWKGKENEATLYFKEKTYNRLGKAFKPEVHDAMAQVGVTRWFQQLNDAMGMIPFGEAFRLDLDQYVNDAALDGLFTMLSKEEKKIRQNPAARVTELLKEVFGQV